MTTTKILYVAPTEPADVTTAKDIADLLVDAASGDQTPVLLDENLESLPAAMGAYRAQQAHKAVRAFAIDRSLLRMLAPYFRAAPRIEKEAREGLEVDVPVYAAEITVRQVGTLRDGKIVFNKKNSDE